MQPLIDVLPWLVAMSILIACSGFYSASEAAFFSLTWDDRRTLRTGSSSHRIAGALLDDPDRLLSAVLLWNLAINMVYFAMVTVVGMHIERHPEGGNSKAAAFVATALMTIIFFSEMLPKSLAVLASRRLAGLAGIPLAIAVRLVDPIMPVLKLVNLLSRRMVWPGFRPEPYLEAADLERAIELSTEDAHLVEQEQSTLRNIVMLSQIRADEWMRPRTQFVSFRPPVSLAELGGEMTPSGYLLVTEPDSEEIAGSIHLRGLADIPDRHLERLAHAVAYVPWCATVADVLEQLQASASKVAAIVNEFGETIGILTFDDILDTVFTRDPTRSGRLLHRKAIEAVEGGCWHVTGLTSLRRLGRYFKVTLPPSKSVTVAGIIQEGLERLAEVGDEVAWGPFHFTVLEAPEQGPLHVRLARVPSEEFPP